MEEIKLQHDVIHYLQKTIRNLTFTFTLNHTVLYTVIAECKYGEKMYNRKEDGFLVSEDGDYCGTKDNDNIADRVKRIMRKFLINPDETTVTNPSPYGKPKIYDRVMKVLQVYLYNSVIDMLDLQQITHCYPDEFLESIYRIDDSVEMDMDALAIIAPYAFAGERQEINFLELVFLSAITLSNARAEKPKHKGEQGFEEYALRQLKNIKKALFSNALYDSLVMTFMDSLCQEVLKKYDKVRLPFIREFLLPPKYQSRKDAEAAFKTYLDKIKNPVYFKDINNNCEEPEITVTLTKDNAFSFADQLKTLLTVEYFEAIIPLTELLLLGSTMRQEQDGFYIFDSYQTATIFNRLEPMKKNVRISSYMYHTANALAEIVKIYVENAVIVAGEMLFSLEESAIVKTDTMIEYFEMI